MTGLPSITSNIIPNSIRMRSLHNFRGERHAACSHTLTSPIWGRRLRLFTHSELTLNIFKQQLTIKFKLIFSLWWVSTGGVTVALFRLGRAAKTSFFFDIDNTLFFPCVKWKWLIHLMIRIYAKKYASNLEITLSSHSLNEVFSAGVEVFKESI